MYRYTGAVCVCVLRHNKERLSADTCDLDSLKIDYLFHHTGRYASTKLYHIDVVVATEQKQNCPQNATNEFEIFSSRVESSRVESYEAKLLL
jgi:hypothetical protein